MTAAVVGSGDERMENPYRQVQIQRAMVGWMQSAVNCQVVR